MTERDAAATVQTKVRMKEPLRSQIEEAAKEHGVSMNAEMCRRLETSFQSDALAETLAKIHKRIDQMEDKMSTRVDPVPQHMHTYSTRL